MLRLGYDKNDFLSNYDFCCFVAVDSCEFYDVQPWGDTDLAVVAAIESNALRIEYFGRRAAYERNTADRSDCFCRVCADCADAALGSEFVDEFELNGSGSFVASDVTEHEVGKFDRSGIPFAREHRIIVCGALVGRCHEGNACAARIVVDHIVAPIVFVVGDFCDEHTFVARGVVVACRAALVVKVSVPAAARFVFEEVESRGIGVGGVHIVSRAVGGEQERLSGVDYGQFVFGAFERGVDLCRSQPAAEHTFVGGVRSRSAAVVAVVAVVHHVVDAGSDNVRIAGAVVVHQADNVSEFVDERADAFEVVANPCCVAAASFVAASVVVDVDARHFCFGEAV